MDRLATLADRFHMGAVCMAWHTAEQGHLRQAAAVAGAIPRPLFIHGAPSLVLQPVRQGHLQARVPWRRHAYLRLRG